jgi:hypothetical protein
MPPKELAELKNKLQELLDEGYIGPALLLRVVPLSLSKRRMVA